MKILLLIVICFSGLNALAQVNGKVTDEKGQALPGSVIRLYTNNQLSKTILTDTAGYFNANLPGLDQLIITALGYQSDTVFTVQRVLGTIRLQPVVSQLKEVNIQGRQSMIRQETDRSIISVNESVKKLAANGLEIVGLAPGITISDNQDAILMSGKSQLQIMINDKVVKMTARDLAKMLKAIPTGDIKQVEFLSNPPAKYEVNGNTGIINIKTVGAVKGVTGNLDLSTSQGVNNWADLSGLVNYGEGKLAVSGYAAWHRGGYLSENVKERQLDPGTLNQQTSNLDKWSDPVFRIALDYAIKGKSTLGAIIEREASTNVGSYDTYSRQGANTYQTNSQNPNTRHWNTYNLNYRYSDTLGTELTLDLDRADFRKESQITLLSSGQVPTGYLTQTGISISTLKADYTHSWKNKLKAEVGLKIAVVETDNNQNTNQFHYSEQIRAAYGSLSGSYPRWGWQLGLRAEQTNAKGKTSQVMKPDTSYLNLLPSLYLNWKPSEKHHFRLSLSRRIMRPDYSDLQPFVYLLDPLNQQTGNPGLRVQRNTQAELTYTFNDRITLIGTYSSADDYFSTLYFQSGNILTEMPGNAGKMQTINFDLNYPIRVSKWWNMLNKVNAGNDHFTGALFQGKLDQDKWRYQFSTSQRFTFRGKYQLQISGRYTSASQNLIYYQLRSANVSASVSRKVFKEQASLRLAISDIFKTQRNYTRVNFGSLNYTDFGTFESRRVSLNFSWRFGNTKVRQTQDRDRGDADEKGRSGS
ncbi:outer membrane beta-barrel family protein [Pedobacter aquatilis]|uniref:outer membrane beta-barrel family protein n=1 Tax=Pedobacter aquatilis TaxID=351343 RepID=UPI00292E00A3|nr:outer membrane beta-barrel family protein [Pedobacter aquatilis]